MILQIIIIVGFLLSMIATLVYYFTLIYNKPWSTITTTRKYIFFGLLGLTAVFAAATLVILLLSFVNKSRSMIMNIDIPTMLSEKYDTFEFSDDNNRKRNTTLKIASLAFSLDFNNRSYVVPESDYLDFSRDFRYVIDRIDINDFLSSRFELVELFPKNRYMAYYFNSLIVATQDERLGSTRLTQDLAKRGAIIAIFREMIEKCRDEGFDKKPSRILKNLAKNTLVWYKSLSAYEYSVQ